MPTYEYVCETCGNFDHFQSMTDVPLTTCPQCGGRQIKRLISGGAGVIFKGSGFYETDYKRKKDAAAPEPKKNAPAQTATAPKKDSPVSSGTTTATTGADNAAKKD